MIKKILGVLFFVFAVLLLILSFLTKNMVGSIIPAVLYLSSGFFLLTFDNAVKNKHIDGFKERKTQCVVTIIFLSLFTLLMFLTGFVSGVNNDSTSFGKLFLLSVINALPYFIPMMVYITMLSVYVIPFFNCNKRFGIDNTKLNEYLSASDEFIDYSGDNTVLASNKIILFTKTYCIIPFEYIESVKFYNAIEQDIIFKLTNGKKIEVVANKKKFNAVEKALSIYKSNN